MLGRHEVVRLLHAAGHRGGSVRLVVEGSSQTGDDSFGHQLADKADAALEAMPYVGSQVDLREIHVARNPRIQQARVSEIESDDADVGASLQEIRLERRMDRRTNQTLGSRKGR